MDELLRAPIEPEIHATCADCAMCKPADAPADPAAHYFNPRVKCCTFLPSLPNFLVGRILLDPDPGLAPGRASVEARIAAGVGLTPLGLGRSAAQDAHDPGSGFGHDEALLCPHYVQEGGLCGIWPHREATCATFFCKHVRGAAGAAFWNALHRLLQSVEQALAWHCLEALDVGPVAVSILLDAAGDSLDAVIARRPDGTFTPEGRRAIWGDWAGRERAFYEAAAGLVETMSWGEILERGGPQVRLHARRVSDAHARVQMPTVPAGPLRLRPLGVSVLGTASVRITTYSSHDPISIPRELFDALPRFDGRPTVEALRSIEEEDGLQVELAVVRHLLDFEVLTPSGESVRDELGPIPPA
jgi:hypothetical protein